MKMKHVTSLLLLTLMLVACNQPRPATATATVTAPPTTDQCYYVWAYKDLPEASQQFQQMLQKAIPEATSSVYEYGENCVYADGHSTFGAMETDINITIPVDDLKDDKATSLSLEKVLPILAAFATDHQSARIKQIEFRFHLKLKDESRYVRFQLQVGLDAIAKGLHGSALLEALNANSP